MHLLARGGDVEGDRDPGDENCSILGPGVNAHVHWGIGEAWSISTVVNITETER